MEGFERVTVYGVSFDVASKQPIVLLKVEGKNRFLPIWIGHPEAAAILMKLQNAELPRPMTHDLLATIIEQLSASVASVLVTELRDNTFYAVLSSRRAGRRYELDSRPSDAIALAVRTDAPIFASAELLGCERHRVRAGSRRRRGGRQGVQAVPRRGLARGLLAVEARPGVTRRSDSAPTLAWLSQGGRLALGPSAGSGRISRADPRSIAGRGSPGTGRL